MKLFNPPHPTISPQTLSSIIFPSSQNPGCTSDVCTMVLRVAVSQRKRSAMGRAAMGPPVGSPEQMREKERSEASISERSAPELNARIFSMLRVYLVSRKSSSLQNNITPIFMNSPRSTRGT